MRSLALAAVLVAPVATQTAAVVLHGHGCLAPPMVLEPAIAVSGMPRLASTIEIRYQGLEGVLGGSELVPILLTGTAQAQTPVPMTILPQQRPGCSIWLKAEHALPMGRDPNRPGQFVSEVSLRIPRLTSLLGVTWHHQWVVAYLDCRIPGSCTLEALGATGAVTLRTGI